MTAFCQPSKNDIPAEIQEWFESFQQLHSQIVPTLHGALQFMSQTRTGKEEVIPNNTETA